MKPEKVMTESSFKARDIGLRAQKKILSKMAGKNVSRMFIDENTSTLLDNIYEIAKTYSNSEEVAEKLIKNIIKTVIKFTLLYKKNLLEDREEQELEILKTKVKNLAMMITTFHDMDYTYDKVHLNRCLTECENAIINIAVMHLTPSSQARIHKVFIYFNDGKFLDSVFNKDSEYRELLTRLVGNLHKAIENKVFGQ